MQKSFTLIELLVVIAIVGLLASVVLVSMTGLQSKAKITKTLEFSQSLQRNLGVYAVGIWSFDDQTNPTKDSSGYNNHGTVNGATFTSDTPHLAAGVGAGKYALSFDGTNDYVDLRNGASLQNLPNVTVEAWVKPTATPLFGDVVGKASYASGGWVFRISQGGNGRLTPHVYTNTWHTCSGSVIPLNVWTHIVIRYDGTTLKGYVNGVEDCSVTPTVGGNLLSNATLVQIGKNSGGADYFPGLIDEVRIYEKAITLGQIQQHYTEGLEQHQGFVIK